ncbi:MAG: hypothetical protein ACE5HD_02410 [Acidobacteriota bacterium]
MRLRKACFLLGAAWCLPVPLAASIHAVPVQITLPVDPKIDTTGIHRILLGGFLPGDARSSDMEGVVIHALRSDLERYTDFLILEDLPDRPSEPSLEALKRNREFFRSLAEKAGADLVIAGRIIYQATDRSGFIQEDYISSATGRRSVRTRYVEQTAFHLDLDLIFVRGADGEVLHDQSFRQDDLIRGTDLDPLEVLRDLTRQLRDSYLQVLLPGQRKETRYLFTN